MLCGWATIAIYPLPSNLSSRLDCSFLVSPSCDLLRDDGVVRFKVVPSLLLFTSTPSLLVDLSAVCAVAAAVGEVPVKDIGFTFPLRVRITFRTFIVARRMARAVIMLKVKRTDPVTKPNEPRSTPYTVGIEMHRSPPITSSESTRASTFHISLLPLIFNLRALSMFSVARIQKKKVLMELAIDKALGRDHIGRAKK
jgi:hypothetical protein